MQNLIKDLNPRMVLTYDAYSKTIEERQTKENNVENLKDEIMLLKEAISDMQNLLRIQKN
jgi:hypothetical protein